MRNKQIVWMLGFLSAAAMAVYLWVSTQGGSLGFPLDDAWIHQTYARNFANGYGWSFIPGENSGGLTAPLWGLLLALGQWLNLGPFLFTFLLGWGLLFSVAWLAGRGLELLIEGQNKLLIFFSCLIAFEWHMLWAALSGMETLLFTMLVLLFFVRLFQLNSAQSSASWAFYSGILIGLSVWVRPEGLSLLGPLGLVLVFSNYKFTDKLRLIFASLLGAGILLIPYLLFNQWLNHSWWPNTFYAKQAEYASHQLLPLLARLWEQLRLPLVGIGSLLLPGFVYALYLALRKKNAVMLAAALWTVGFYVLYAIVLPVSYQHGRYGMPAIPVYLLIGMAGMQKAFARWSPSRLGDLLRKASLLALLLLGVSFFALGASAYRRDVSIINSEMVATARWINENLPAEALLAVHDIGAIGYFSQQPIVDLAALITPEVVPFIRDETQLAAYLDSRGARFLVCFPSWYPSLTSGKEPIYPGADAPPQPLGGENMSVYCWDCD